MRTKHAVPVATLGVLAALVLPSVAAADSDTKARGWKGDTGSNRSITAEVISRSSTPSIRQHPAKPRSNGSGGFAQNIAGALQRLQPPAFSSLSDLCRSTVNDSSGTVSVPCRAVGSSDPDDPAAPGSGGGATQPVDAPRLAERAASQIDLPTPTLNTSPADPVKTLVGLETWLWVPQGQWQTLTASAEAGGAEVTVTAEPIQSRWDMGEEAVNCAGPGREWRKGLGTNATTPCSYTYEKTSVKQPGKKHDISAALRYRVTWECEGDCNQDGGDLGTLDTVTSTSQLEVSERQSVVVSR
ncbi:hypothetical protein [Aeromicrobium sp. CTD01-1L150]|uniref:hypothetical protein n=1 Tax=Aeromicrobium sp. CTD01-1L150 TaxID=3341830 RepID=UPI0035C085DD